MKAFARWLVSPACWSWGWSVNFGLKHHPEETQAFLALGLGEAEAAHLGNLESHFGHCGAEMAIRSHEGLLSWVLTAYIAVRIILRSSLVLIEAFVFTRWRELLLTRFAA
jgi:hypothetical protein